jgi:hypothetical protein
MTKAFWAYAFYVAGAVGALYVAVSGIVSGELESALTGLAYALAVWWLAAGVAVRLGRTPGDVRTTVLALLGRARR